MGWVMQGGGRVGHALVGLGGSCRGGMSHVGVVWVMQGGRSYRGGMGHAGMGCGLSDQGGVGWELQGTESRNATGYQI